MSTAGCCGTGERLDGSTAPPNDAAAPLPSAATVPLAMEAVTVVRGGCGGRVTVGRPLLAADEEWEADDARR